ncbi:hypothetical protein Hypma_015860 [Hypsizygus marmoreus]|uniref:Uncharacterized protein n=1 Tax=Hypsizygus marmoreus TaxID=39966 RepID=A0A369K3Z8_HYPMA|nr:hypothetical protein Hypma_015860 [Hypsizygus marmoreus]
MRGSSRCGWYPGEYSICGVLISSPFRQNPPFGVLISLPAPPPILSIDANVGYRYPSSLANYAPSSSLPNAAPSPPRPRPYHPYHPSPGS